MPKGYLQAIFGAGWPAWGRAFLEISVVVVISLVPLLAGAFREVIVPPLNIQGDAFARAFLSGQLIFYAIGLVATIAWQSNRDWANFMPWRALINVFCLVVIGLCCIIVGADPTLASLDRSVAAWTSVGMFGAACLVYVFMCLVVEVHPDMAAAIKKDDQGLTEALKASRRIND
jgi:hypothetical protein